MTLSTEAMTGHTSSAKAASEPPLWYVVLIFWAAFVVAIVATGVTNPHLFEHQDPDSFLRIVQVRDLMAGQSWFDLVQHRMDPPGGALLQWSRLIDAAIAGLVIVGNAIGLGETFALYAWPLLLLLAMMASVAAIGFTLGGRKAAIWSLVLSLFSLDPLIVYLPGDIDHHNAQIAVTLATVAFALRFGSGPLFGVLAAAGTALTLAIGLEMLPYVVMIGAFIAGSWAVTGRHPRVVGAYGLTLAALPTLLYLVAGSPAASMACDSLSWVYAAPIAIMGAGLAAMALAGARLGRRSARIGGLLVVGAVSTAVFAWLGPACLLGPYGFVPEEVKQAFLRTVTEAQPFQYFAAREPVGAFATAMPMFVAFAVLAWRLQDETGEAWLAWLLPALLVAMASALSFYQIRTLPFATAMAVPALGVWVASVRARSLVFHVGAARRALPVALAVLACTPITYTLIGIPGFDALTYLSDGRIAAKERSKPPEDQIEGLTVSEKNCFDPSASALFAEVPRGLVLSPVFYGSSVLMLSGHDVVAGPYHRNGDAILDAVHATHWSTAEAKAIVDRRHVDYVAVCAVSAETWNAIGRAPEGFVADLVKGNVPAWLKPVPAAQDTKLRLWRVVR